MRVAGTPVPVFTPLSGERGQGDRDNKSEVNFKNRLFLQSEATVKKLWLLLFTLILKRFKLCEIERGFLIYAEVEPV